MTSHLRGPSTLFAIGIGFANMCGGTVAGVANANELSQARYEVSGPAVAQYISYQTDTGQQRAVNAPTPLVDAVHRFWRPGIRHQRPGTGTHLLQDPGRRQRRERSDGDGGHARQNRLFALTAV